MSKLPQDIVRDYATLGPTAKADTVAKLRRYVARGRWAQAQLTALGLPLEDGPAAPDGASADARR